MAKTPNLGLNLTTDETTFFDVWRKSIDGNDEENPSNMKLIDELVATKEELQEAIQEAILDTWEASY